MWKTLEKQPFFRADMVELGKYCMGGYDRIGLYSKPRRMVISSSTAFSDAFIVIIVKNK